TTSAIVTAALELDAGGERPAVARPIDADIVDAGLHTEGVEKPMVIVRVAVTLVNGDVDFVGSLDELEAIDREGRLGIAGEPLGGHFLEVGIRPVAADAVGVEQAHAEDEVVGRLSGPHLYANRHRIAGVEDEGRLAALIDERDVGDLDLARSPAPFDGSRT